MRIFRFWARGEAPVETVAGSWNVQCFGGSNESVATAKRRANEIAQRTAAAIAAGKPSRYAYGDRPLREEIIEEFTAGDERYAAITRNGYGSLVLNTTRAFFADIDYAKPTGTQRLRRAIGWMVGRRKQRPQDEQVIERIQSITELDPTLAFRLYRTFGGFRCVATSRPFEPGTLDADHLLERLGADPLYVRLCSAQACFRARLTPKCWRIDFRRPPHSFPWRTDAEERAHRDWEKQYGGAIRRFATCAFVGSFGNAPADRAIAKVVEIHDHATLNGVCPLA